MTSRFELNQKSNLLTVIVPTIGSTDRHGVGTANGGCGRQWVTPNEVSAPQRRARLCGAYLGRDWFPIEVRRALRAGKLTVNLGYGNEPCAECGNPGPGLCDPRCGEVSR